MKKLCLLDLDHTLIYGSYASSEQVKLLFEYNEFLKIYKRPFVKEFVRYIQQYFDDIIVFTSAKKDYAEEICKLLNIQEKQLLSREQCFYLDPIYCKAFKPEWAEDYDLIFIVDDTPNAWRYYEEFEDKIHFIIPTEFRGETTDTVLKELISQLEDLE